MNTSEPVIDFDSLIEKYVRIRDKKGQLAKAQKAELAKFDTALAAIERLLLTEFQRTGANSVNTDHGTAFKKTQTSVTIADSSVFRDFIRSSEDHWIFCDLRANAPAVKAYLDENEALPPGVNLVSRLTVNVQR